MGGVPRTFPRCLAAGDAHAARHLAYYAELRAALSLLATQGIVVLTGLNFDVDARWRATSPVAAAPTHEMCWLLLEHWGSSPSAFDAPSLPAMTIRGATLSDALRAYFPSPVPDGFLSGQLVRDWGFDLSRGHLDPG
jgi:hypothetical protein